MRNPLFKLALVPALVAVAACAAAEPEPAVAPSPAPDPVVAEDPMTPPAAPAPAEAPAAPEPAAPPVAAPSSPYTLPLEAVGESGVSGEVVFRSVGQETELGVQVNGPIPNASLLAFVYRGSCDERGEMIAPLPAVTTDAEGSGTATAIIPVPFAAVVTTPISIQVHREGGDTPADALVCGDIVPGSAGA